MQPTFSSAAALGALDAATFVAAVGPVYECSPWIAERAHAAGAPFASLTAIDEALWAVVSAANDDEQLGLLRAHPDLAGKAALAGGLTAESTDEQARAGLSQLTPDELAEFTALNDAYKARFGFPFILAVRNASKRIILASFRRRVTNAPGLERAECLAQVRKIAWMRLRLIAPPAPTGKLTCHVLDTAHGCPAHGLPITLRYLGGTGDADPQPVVIGRFVTNDDGRLDGPALQGHEFKEGVYEWMFSVGEYFAIRGTPASGTPFLGEVPLRFGIDNPEKHYHVPLLCSPWSYSTYRGS
jgi:2-oxo-4-hydroxy-4-carboxy-5-ureidoimidazoline decarboxylase